MDAAHAIWQSERRDAPDRSQSRLRRRQQRETWPSAGQVRAAARCGRLDKSATWKTIVASIRRERRAPRHTAAAPVRADPNSSRWHTPPLPWYEAAHQARPSILQTLCERLLSDCVGQSSAQGVSINRRTQPAAQRQSHQSWQSGAATAPMCCESCENHRRRGAAVPHQRGGTRRAASPPSYAYTAALEPSRHATVHWAPVLHLDTSHANERLSFSGSCWPTEARGGDRGALGPTACARTGLKPPRPR